MNKARASWRSRLASAVYVACAGSVMTGAALVFAGLPAAAQPQQSRPGQSEQTPSQTQGRGQRGPTQIDEERARRLYVGTDAKDYPPPNYAAQIEAREKTDARFAEIARGVVDYQKIKYRSSIGDLDVPAHLFQPLARRGPRGHAALVWVHGGVHGNQTEDMWPFIREAVERGYVVIAPDYRGSTGYGEAHYQAIDYGGYEVDDVMSGVGFLKTLPHVDQDRLGIIGWSHGGYITLFSVFRDQTPFKAAAAIVPVTNLVFRLSYKGPGYQRDFATQKRIGGLPFEKPDVYIQRSPLYSVDKLHTPLLVHVATNDTDVNFVEDQQMIDALRSRKSELAETKIYVDPPVGAAGGGHTFSRRVNHQTLQREDSPEQRDSWNRTWAFLEWHLRPYEDRSKAAGTKSDK